MFHRWIFPHACPDSHIRRRLIGSVLSAFLASLAIVFSVRAEAEPYPADDVFTFACAYLGDCPIRTVPGAPDREVRPFEGTLGRPCTWRERPTPSGPRRVRACS